MPFFFFFFQAEDGIRDDLVTGVQTCALPIYFYRQQVGNNARILILDNHDDFGGHAKRNEFTSGGKKLIGYGGTQAIAGPNLYSAEAKQLFKYLGIEGKHFETYYDRKF